MNASAHSLLIQFVSLKTTCQIEPRQSKITKQDNFCYTMLTSSKRNSLVIAGYSKPDLKVYAALFAVLVESYAYLSLVSYSYSQE